MQLFCEEYIVATAEGAGWMGCPGVDALTEDSAMPTPEFRETAQAWLSLFHNAECVIFGDAERHLFAALVASLVAQHGADCIIDEGGNKITLLHCTDDYAGGWFVITSGTVNCIEFLGDDDYAKFPCLQDVQGFEISMDRYGGCNVTLEGDENEANGDEDNEE